MIAAASLDYFGAFYPRVPTVADKPVHKSGERNKTALKASDTTASPYYATDTTEVFLRK